MKELQLRRTAGNAAVGRAGERVPDANCKRLPVAPVLLRQLSDSLSSWLSFYSFTVAAGRPLLSRRTCVADASYSFHRSDA